MHYLQQLTEFFNSVLANPLDNQLSIGLLALASVGLLWLLKAKVFRTQSFSDTLMLLAGFGLFISTCTVVGDLDSLPVSLPLKVGGGVAILILLVALTVKSWNNLGGALVLPAVYGALAFLFTTVHHHGGFFWSFMAVIFVFGLLSHADSLNGQSSETGLPQLFLALRPLGDTERRIARTRAYERRARAVPVDSNPRGIVPATLIGLLIVAAETLAAEAYFSLEVLPTSAYVGIVISGLLGILLAVQKDTVKLVVPWMLLIPATFFGVDLLLRVTEPPFYSMAAVIGVCTVVVQRFLTAPRLQPER